MIGFTLAFALTQRKPLTLSDPPAVPTAPVTTAEGAVVYANALPGASAGAAGGAGAGAARGANGRGGAGGARGVSAPGGPSGTAGDAGSAQVGK
jgi:hypothetical protein